MGVILQSLLAYLISLAAGLRSDAISEGRRKRLKEKLAKEASALQAIQERKTLIEQLRLVGTQAARFAQDFGMRNEEQPLVDLLTDDVFQSDLVDWLIAWRPLDKKAAESVLVKQMAAALKRGGADEEQIETFKAGYFRQVEKVVFSEPELSTWRMHLALNAAFERLDELEAVIKGEGKETRFEVREQHREMRERIPEIVVEILRVQKVQFTKEQRTQAVGRYQELALESCDIIDLINLPEGDRHIATQQLALRRLYVPLRVQVEYTADQELVEEDLGQIEKERDKVSRMEIHSREHLASIGERLMQSKRLVLLGNPGSGKTTLIRWISTAYLLRAKKKSDFKDLPDVQTLPDKDWLPIIVHCKYLDESSKLVDIDDLIFEVLRKLRMPEDDMSVVLIMIKEFLAEGKAILFFDGLDEIGNIKLRHQVSRLIERLPIRFPLVCVIVTSRIVGYREIGRRLCCEFEHVTIAELSNSDKDEFAMRWCEIKELPERCKEASEELIEDIHNNTCIEKLTGNPMLLTTIALIKREKGILPNRRADLYNKAVKILINWHSEVEESIDQKDSLLLLGYLAYDIHSRGISQLREDGVINLFIKMHEEYPRMRVLKKYTPTKLLSILKNQSALFIEVGEKVEKDLSAPVFEFCHRTFLEYMTALALANGKFPGRGGVQDVADFLARLAVQTSKTNEGVNGESVLKGNWHEVMRLYVGSCSNDDVIENLLSAILKPLNNENREKILYRVAIAALCLADDPDVREGFACEVLQTFAQRAPHQDKKSNVGMLIDYSAKELARSEWSGKLRRMLVVEFCKNEGQIRYRAAELVALINEASAPIDKKKFQNWLSEKVNSITINDDLSAIDVALNLFFYGKKGNIQRIPGMINRVLVMLDKDTTALAASWALFALADKKVWIPTEKERRKLNLFISKSSPNAEAAHWVIKTLDGKKLSQEVDGDKMLVPEKLVDDKKVEHEDIKPKVPIASVSYLNEKLDKKSNLNLESDRDVFCKVDAGDTKTLLGKLLAYLIKIAADIHYEEIVEKWSDDLQIIQDYTSLMKHLSLARNEIMHLKEQSGISDVENSLFNLFINQNSQNDLAQWISAWRPQEKRKAEAVLAKQMADALKRGGADDKQIETFKAGYFQKVEKIVFSEPELSTWRMHLALNASFERLDELEAVIKGEGKETRSEVREQHKETRQTVPEIVAEILRLQKEKYPKKQRTQAVERYRELALESCDIIDLANLPEGDRHLATQQLALRRLYVPLRVKAEFFADQEFGEQGLEKIDKMWEGMQRKGPGKDKKEQRTSVGERLAESRRLVLLGDPGAGKTTLLRWIATAYLLRLKKDPAYKDLPDVKTLPDEDWLPIIIRCRDLDESCKTGTIDDVLCETFRKAQLTTDESSALQVVMREKLAAGKAVLLVDGLDEIANVSLRARFCQQIERLNIAFPKAPVIVTSRIVGYREMGYRIGRGFEHATVAEFSKEDKDEFAIRWCDITELPERKEKAAQELIRDIHSADRIERLTGNPMLLTTMALVKRKVGKLPSRRADLYWEAVLELLNWRSEVDDPIDHREAVPQLEYVAYQMCSHGVPRLRMDEVISLLGRMRKEYPHMRPINRNDPETFLRMLVQRTGILVEVGEVPHFGRPVPVFEFRHLTFQEYLAALALVDGRFPGRDKNKTLAEHIASLAGQTEQIIQTDAFTLEKSKELVVRDKWREVLRLCVACCSDDDVDDVLTAILTPLGGEDSEQTARPRAVLAALCLADEPNVSDEVAQEVLQVFSQQVKRGDGIDRILTIVDSAALELVGSEWEKMLQRTLVEEFCRRGPYMRSSLGTLFSMMDAGAASIDEIEPPQWHNKQVIKLKSGSILNAIEAAISIMTRAFKAEIQFAPEMVEGLISMLNIDAPSSHAGAWALFHLFDKNIWIPTQKDIDQIIDFVLEPSSDIMAIYWIMGFLSKAKESNIIDLLLERMSDNNENVRRTALKILSMTSDEEKEWRLLSRDFNGLNPWLDPREPIDGERVREAAENLGIPEAEVRSRYERLAEKYRLKLSWKS